MLAPAAGETILDCTAGAGGHAALLAASAGPGPRVALCDLDTDQLDAAAAHVRRARPDAEIVLLAGNFADAPRRLAELGWSADVALADLGFSSMQVDEPGHGMSFRRDEPLDMRFDRTAPTTAADLVNGLTEQELAEILRDYGEERAARRIAQKLVARRASAPIRTTTDLAGVVRSALGGRRDGDRLDPATRTFQALRIAVNDELGNLDALLEAVGRAAFGLRTSTQQRTWLAPGARVGVIAFHSLEDRRVKTAFRELASRGLATSLTKGPLVATDEEQARNPRARSAKLRAIRLGRPSERAAEP